MKLNVFSTYVIGILFIGTTLIPGNIFVDNYNLPRNLFFSFICSIYTVLFLLLSKNGFRINQASIFSLLCLLLCVVRNGINNQQFEFIIAFSGLLIILNQVTIKQELLCKILTVCLIIENAFCILQLFKITPSFNHFFKVTGSYENPNTCGLFISLCIPFLLDFYKRRQKSLYLIVVIFSVTFVFIMGCRVSLACIIFSILYMYVNNLNARKKHLTIFFIIAPIILVLCTIKTNSSLGRLLIFMATLKLLIETPLNGWGYNGFTREYMKNQSEILSNRHGEYFMNLEGNPLHPLNEYLHYICNVGIWGIIAIACFAFTLYKHRKFYDKCMYSCIITVVIQSMFTYSLRYAFTWTFIAILLTQSSRHKRHVLPLAYVRTFVILLTLYCTYTTFKQSQFEMRWRKVWRKATNEGITMQVRYEKTTYKYSQCEFTSSVDSLKKIAKIYRLTYWKSQQVNKRDSMIGYKYLTNPYTCEVTNEYKYITKNNIIEAKVGDFSKLFVCTYTQGDGWIPVGRAKQLGSNHVDIGSLLHDNIVVISEYANGFLTPVSSPYLIRHDKKPFKIEADLNKKEDITLYRKYLLRNIWINRWAEIKGTNIETSNDRNFNTKPIVLYQFKNLPTSETCRITLNRQLKDYLRIVPSKGIFPVFAEIKLFDANHAEIKDNLYNIYAIGNSLTGDTIVTRKLHDNNLKTTFYKRFPFWIGINIKKIKDKVSYIQLTMWNDENQIIRGHDYELFYYDKNKWNSLGKQRASKDCLLYQNVPKNSLLLLRDYSEGQEERIFMYKHNKQIWY